MPTPNRTPNVRKVKKTKIDKSTYINKLVDTKNKSNTNVDISAGNLEGLSNSVVDRIKNNENITELFPDVELSIQILTSSIISPNDMLSTSLIYDVGEVNIPNEVNTHILSTIESYIKKNYKLEEKLMVILREALFTKGAYIEAIIPENKIAKVIEESKKSKLLSVEDYMDYVNSQDDLSLGVFNKDIDKDGLLSIEEFDGGDQTLEVKYDIEKDIGVDITDNIGLMVSTEQYLDIVDENMMDTLYGENSLSVEEDVTYKNLFKSKRNNQEVRGNILNLDIESDRESLGKPLVLKITPEAAIPVHVKGDPSKHLGYFILLDETGSPIVSNNEKVDLNPEDHVPDLYANDRKTEIINKAKTALKGITKKDPTIKNIEEIYTKIVEHTVRNKLKNSVYNEMADFSDDSDLYRIMFSRALKNKRTKMLYLPKEMVSYFAFEYRENGTGKSYLEKVSLLFSIRAIILFNTIMGHLKNNTTTTEITADIDETDPDPEKAMEKIISEVMKTRQMQMPYGVTRVDDLVDWSHKSQFKWNFNHPGLPATKISSEEVNSSKVIPDSELEDKIQEFIIMSFGLTKDMVMSGYDPEFATTVIANNVLLAKRVSQLQYIFNGLLTKHIKKLLLNDANIKEAIRTIAFDNASPIKRLLKKYMADDQVDSILNNRKKLSEFVVKLYINELEVRLPSPELQEAQNMKEALESFSTAADDYLDMLISETAFPEEYTGEGAYKAEEIKAVMKTVLVKNWMTDNKYIPEMSDFLTLDKEGNPKFNILEQFEEYRELVFKSLIPFIKKSEKFKETFDDKISAIEETNNEPDETFEDDPKEETPTEGDSDGNIEGGEEIPIEGEDPGTGEPPIADDVNVE